MTLSAVNWNRPDDDFTLLFWNQNIQQFWTDDEIPLSDDKMSWMEMTDIQRDTYMKVLGGLTLLDTLQGGVGMPKILEHVDGLQRKSLTVQSLRLWLLQSRLIQYLLGLKQTHSYKSRVS